MWRWIFKKRCLSSVFHLLSLSRWVHYSRDSVAAMVSKWPVANLNDKHVRVPGTTFLLRFWVIHSFEQLEQNLLVVNTESQFGQLSPKTIPSNSSAMFLYSLYFSLSCFLYLWTFCWDCRSQKMRKNIESLGKKFHGWFQPSSSTHTENREESWWGIEMMTSKTFSVPELSCQWAYWRSESE